MERTKTNLDKATKDTQTLYNEYQFGNFSYKSKRERFDPLLNKFLSYIRNNHSVYDIGCGSGYYTNTYLNQGLKKDQLTLIDLAPSNIDNLKKHGFNAIEDDILNLKLNDKVSDFTICQGVIHHTTQPFKAFSELVRITKKGGFIYLNVYNKWHPFFYIVHKATFPLRYIYWNWNKKILDFIFPISKIFIQPLAYLLLGETLDDKTAKTIFMDQVITPRAHLFSKSDLLSYTKKCNCTIRQFKYNRYFLMLAAIIHVEDFSS